MMTESTQSRKKNRPKTPKSLSKSRPAPVQSQTEAAEVQEEEEGRGQVCREGVISGDYTWRDKPCDCRAKGAELQAVEK